MKPSEELDLLARIATERNDHARRVLINELRLRIKILLHDLEATRREKVYLAKRLEETQK